MALAGWGAMAKTTDECSDLTDLVDYLRETLDIELKDWIDLGVWINGETLALPPRLPVHQHAGSNERRQRVTRIEPDVFAVRWKRGRIDFERGLPGFGADIRVEQTGCGRAVVRQGH